MDADGRVLDEKKASSDESLWFGKTTKQQ